MKKQTTANMKPEITNNQNTLDSLTDCLLRPLPETPTCETEQLAIKLKRRMEIALEWSQAINPGG